MDGNGRWARERGQIASAGHKAGIDALQRTVESCIEHGIGYLTVFALSVENNRNRDDQEVKFLISLMYSVVHERLQKLHDEGVKLIFVGSIQALEDQGLLEVIKRAEILTKENTRLVLTVSLNFSGRDDIVQATRSLLKLVQENQIDPSDIDVSTFGNHLSMSHIPEGYRDPDLLIRTGGEQRLSNFLLWQLAYSELYFSDTYWPDFDAEDFSIALEEYSKRDRRFGARIP
ncbi:hypothetical protein M9434_001645 [Picochlorum sp. BPE23]|nr:hypothetical protein M9434_001645 [Picochlorum sp. BPE23]KAI8110360.1 hypothetical protein M9435_002036 [Picochlorum sp. BPE23]